MWNYRVIKTDSNGEPSYAIHEVYYDEAGRPQMYTEDPVSLYAESVDSLREEHARFALALNKEVLTPDDFIKNERR